MFKGLKNDERGLIPMLIVLITLVVIIVAYSYLRIRAKQEGF